MKLGLGLSLPGVAASGRKTRAVLLPGVVGNYVATPTAAKYNDVSGDFEMVFRLKLPDYSSSATRTFWARFDGPSGSGRQFLVGLSATNRFEFGWWNGSAVVNTSVANPAQWVNGTPYWFKVAVDVDNGSTQHVSTFQWAADAPSEPTTWTTIGTSAGAGVMAFVSSTFPLVVGSSNTSSRALNGTVYYAEWRNGATVVARFDPNIAVPGASSWTSSNGETWTLATSGGNPARIIAE